MRRWYSYPNRTVCDVLSEMRNSLKSQCVRAEHLLNLVEEAQSCVNRMEAALEDWRDIRSYHDDIRKLRKELRKLEKKKARGGKGD